MFHKTKTGISKIHHLKNSKSETQYRKKKHSAVDFRTRVTFAQVYQNTQRELASGQSFGAQYLENVWIDFKTNFIILYLLKHLYWKNKNILKNDVLCGDDLVTADVQICRGHCDRKTVYHQWTFWSCIFDTFEKSCEQAKHEIFKEK